eukprot:1160698-Pelagomonas_calceolata.AAC.3
MQAGIAVHIYPLPDQVSQEGVEAAVRAACHHPEVDGVLIQVMPSDGWGDKKVPVGLCKGVSRSRSVSTTIRRGEGCFWLHWPCKVWARKRSCIINSSVCCGMQEKVLRLLEAQSFSAGGEGRRTQKVGGLQLKHLFGRHNH